MARDGEGADATVDGSSGSSADAAVDGAGGSGDAGGQGPPADGSSVVEAGARDAALADSGAETGTTTCTGGPTVVACGTSCIDIAMSATNCKACGHDCGAGSSCQSGLCQPVVLYTSTAVPQMAVDGAGIYFSNSSGINSCPLTGCALGPMLIASGTPLLLAHGYVSTYIPLVPVGYDLDLCPESGCTAGNEFSVISDNRSVAVNGLLTSPNNLIFSFNGPPGQLMVVCSAPGPAGCSPAFTLTTGVAPGLLAASDAFVYFSAVIDGGTNTIYSCPTGASNCTPTPMNIVGYNQLVAYNNDVYILLPVTGPLQTIAKCPSTGCAPETTVLTTPQGIGEFAVDASGVYWTLGANILSCPLTGCVGGPVTVAANQGTPQSLRLSGGFVYYINGTDDTIRRVAEPPVP